MRFLAAVLFPLVMTGTTISTVVDCGAGQVVRTGLSTATCSAPPAISADASAGINSVQVSASFETMGTRSVPFASASIDAEYVVTIEGSTGPGFYFPCVSAGGDQYPGGGGYASASGSFGDIGATQNGRGGQDSCSFFRPGFFAPNFTFGQPFHVHGMFSAQAAATPGPNPGLPRGGAGLTGFIILDSQSRPVSGARWNIEIVPEPATALLAMSALAVILRRRRA